MKDGFIYLFSTERRSPTYRPAGTELSYNFHNMNNTIFAYKIKSKYVLKTIAATLLLLFGVAILYILEELNFTKINFHSLSIVGVIFIVPSILLLVEYLVFSLRVNVIVEGNDVIILQNSSEIRYKYSDIIHVTKYCSYPYSQNRRLIYFSTDSFYFMKIKTVDDKEFILTSLMTDMRNFQFKVNTTEGRFIASIIFS